MCSVGCIELLPVHCTWTGLSSPLCHDVWNYVRSHVYWVYYKSVHCCEVDMHGGWGEPREQFNYNNNKGEILCLMLNYNNRLN